MTRADRAALWAIIYLFVALFALPHLTRAEALHSVALVEADSVWSVVVNGEDFGPTPSDSAGVLSLRVLGPGEVRLSSHAAEPPPDPGDEIPCLRHYLAARARHHWLYTGYSDASLRDGVDQLPDGRVGL